MAGARAVGAAGRAWGSSYAGSAGRHSCVRVGTRCSPPAVRCGPVARCVRGQALSPPRLPSSWGLSGSVIRSCCGRGCAGVGDRRCPLGLHALWGAHSAGVVGVVPGGVARHRCEGRLVSGAVPPPVACPLGGPSGSATHMLWAWVCGCGGPALPLGLHVLWGLRAVGLVGGRPREGWPATVVRGIWCQALSLPRPPVLWGGQLGFCNPCVPGAVDAGVGTQHRPHSVRPCGPALLAVGMAEWRPRGGVPSTVVRGV